MKTTVFIIAGIIALFIGILLGSPAYASVVKVVRDTQGYHLMVDTVPYVIRGVSYVPELAGENPNIGNYRDWMIVDDNNDGLIDAPYNLGDFAAMKAMGVNTIRIYHHASDNPAVQALFPPNTGGALAYNHTPNKAVLRDLFNTYGIRVTMGDEMGAYTACSSTTWAAGTDYTNPVQLANMRLCVADMVNQFKNEPWLLMYVLGNENNYPFTQTNAGGYLGQYAVFLDSMAVMIHQMDPNHPVAVSMGETASLGVLASSATHVDIFGVNSYRSQGYSNLFTQVASIYGKPVMFTEWGVAGTPGNEPADAHELWLEWCDIEDHTREAEMNSLGGFMYSWVDSSWQAPPSANRGLVDMNRRQRASYTMMKGLWTGPERCPDEATLNALKF